MVGNPGVTGIELPATVLKTAEQRRKQSFLQPGRRAFCCTDDARYTPNPGIQGGRLLRLSLETAAVRARGLL
jgi:hypothetical protein